MAQPIAYSATDRGSSGSSRRRGADLIVDYLIREGVPYVVGMCGHGNVGLLDALYERRDEIRTLTVHHESAAGFIADAYFRVRHAPLVTFTSSGPGSANLPVALGSALMDSSALLAITGNVPTSQFNRGPFQETGRHHQADFPSAVRPFVKRSFQATRPEQIPLMLRQSFATMLTGRPGPVHLDVPLNVFVEETNSEVPDPDLWRGGVSPSVAAKQEDIERCLDMLLAAERPVIVAGHGVELGEAEPELARFVEAVGIPVAHTPLGKGVFDWRSPLDLGATGRNGTYAANQATRNADVILALGTRFDDRSTSAWLPGYTYAIPPTRLIHVDLDPSEIGRNYPPTLAIIANAKDVLDQLCRAALSRFEQADGAARPNSAVRAAWRERTTAWAEKWERDVAPRRTSEASPIRPERLIADLRAVMPDDSILLSDVGIHHNWLVQEWPAYRPRSVLQSWGFASMGFGVAGVLGARLAAPELPIVSVVGDGGFLLMPSAVATAVEYDLPAVWLVWNNYGFVSIRDLQRGYFGADREFVTSFRRESSGEPYSPDYAAMARAMGAEGAIVERPGDLAGQVEAALASRRPYVLDVQVDREAAPEATASWDLPPLPNPGPAPRWAVE